jgi:23S rRNA (cytosine1962-C5)-methyltransferase
MWLADNWKDYEVIDAGGGEKLEKWGKFILRRPDPQAIWDKDPRFQKQWNDPDAFYHRSKSGGGEWEYRRKLPESWHIKFGELALVIRPTSFKHTGVFPEQAVNWEWTVKKIENEELRMKNVKVLNLFAYTGGATIAALAAGAEVLHLDASKGINEIAKRNVVLSGFEDRPVRFIVDDAVKFVEREIRRGNKYNAIIMDPPSFGRGKSGEVWEIEKSLNELIGLTSEILDNPLFMLVNSYANEISRYAIENIVKDQIVRRFGGSITSDEIGLPITSRKNLVLPCGSSIRWEK